MAMTDYSIPATVGPIQVITKAVAWEKVQDKWSPPPCSDDSEAKQHECASRPYKLVSNETGMWVPTACVPQNKIAIFIPYRNREEHLSIFLNHMHPFLRNQNNAYTIYVIEQVIFCW